jgi:hypothetical protein
MNSLSEYIKNTLFKEKRSANTIILIMGGNMLLYLTIRTMKNLDN